MDAPYVPLKIKDRQMKQKVNYLFVLILIFLIVSIQAVGSYASSNFSDSLTLRFEERLAVVERLRNSDIKTAIALANELLKEVESQQDSFAIAEVRLSLGKCYNYLAANVEALENLTIALTLFEKQQNKVKTAFTLRELGSIYFYLHEFESALTYYKNVLRCGQSISDTSLIITALIGTGSVYGNTNKLDSALLLFTETFQLSKAIQDKPNEIHSLYNIGDVYRYTNRPNKALSVFRSIEKDYDVEKDNSRILPSLYNSMTESCIQIKDLAEAQRYNRLTAQVLEHYPRLDQKMTYFYHSFLIDTLLGNLSSAIQNHIAYKQVSDSINDIKFKEQLANFQTLYELNAKEKEIGQLMLDNRVKDLTIKNKNLLNYGSYLLVALLLVIIFQTLRFLKKINAKNDTLQEQNEELAAANEELYAINDELNLQREKLETTITQLKNTQNRLVQSEKMASIGVLAAGIAHEINNPLNFIRGGVSAIEKYTSENFPTHKDEFLPLIDIVYTGVERAAIIVSSLNYYSRKDTSVVQQCEIHKIIDNCLLILNNRIQNRIDIVKNYNATGISIKCNNGKIHQAILNILSNSLDSISEHGTISISTGQKDNIFVITIADNGCGISADNMNKLVDPFFTTKEPGMGTGLGLSITQNIIEEHNGQLKIESIVGIGTTVLVYLPLLNEKP